MSTSNETRRLFPMHPFIVGTEWVEDFSAVDYGSIKDSPALRQQYLGSMALYAMFCRIADTPQFAYSPAKGVFAYDWDEAFDVTDFVIKLCLYNTDAGTEQLRRMLRHFSQHPFESDAELCLQSAASHLDMDARRTTIKLYSGNESLLQSDEGTSSRADRCAFRHLSDTADFLLRGVYKDTAT